MFHPADRPMERGWVGRIDGDRVVHLAAQTLQSFFTGGGAAREHADYPLRDVLLLAPVLHPPAVRIFEDEASFAFANPAAIAGPEAQVRSGERGRDVPLGELAVAPRLACVVGADGRMAAFTVLAEWRDRSRPRPKDRDFALGLGPTVVTEDALRPEGLGALVRVGGGLALTGAFMRFDWRAALAYAADGTVLRPGDLVAGPHLGLVDVPVGERVEIEVEGLGTLAATAAA